MAGTERSGTGLATVFKGQVHAAQRDAERVGRGIWKVSIIGVWISTSTGLLLKKYGKLADDEVTMSYDYIRLHQGQSPFLDRGPCSTRNGRNLFKKCEARGRQRRCWPDVRQ